MTNDMSKLFDEMNARNARQEKWREWEPRLRWGLWGVAIGVSSMLATVFALS